MYGDILISFSSIIVTFYTRRNTDTGLACTNSIIVLFHRPMLFMKLNVLTLLISPYLNSLLAFLKSSLRCRGKQTTKCGSINNQLYSGMICNQNIIDSR